ncbi:hypothetical protein [Saccharothrix obliqua]|uniref:hypothetical protein n=1 Tax=Saccharothrix obliqua TaxID=2861747 RepID=UPI001C5E707C|nr:hypothetical protein [Saccharothrix obliqua]MBW4720412.1 hypothetical protein [Saccharothrix obliqua]
MRWAVVCGDGLPVSGLLTVLRNVVDRATAAGHLDLPVAADLGYSWRPDKAAFFPAGRSDLRYPDWLEVTDAVPTDLSRDALIAELGAIRSAVADADELTPEGVHALHARIEALAAPYAEHFTRWLDEADVDWVVAVNMTLSDAVPVTVGLRRAVQRRWGAGRPGGALYWDHDLFGSYAVRERGRRVYPTAPNEFTPVPDAATDRWAVVTAGLADETARYPTPLRAEVVPNVLPVVPDGPLSAFQRDFLTWHGLGEDRPAVLVPVRLFQVKGVEIALRVFAGMRAADGPDPALLVFGSLDEDPEYVAEVRRVAADLAVEDAVVFLDGVPLASHRDGSGRPHPDEADLLGIARHTGGAVLFTPNRTDVESVGLGPALAAVADVPCAVTPYAAFEPTYGPDFRYVRVDPEAAHRAGAELMGWLAARRAGRAWVADALATNRELVRARFPDAPWARLLRVMAAATARERIGLGQRS